MRIGWLILAGGWMIALALPPPSAQADEPKTLKERLFDKASDEQRVDNCLVPPHRRGTKPRPDCPPAPGASAPQAAGRNSPHPSAAGGAEMR